jgi:hypothetical protein
MKKVLSALCLLIMVIFWYSCTKDTAPAPPKVITGNCDTTKVNFTKDLLPIINSTCQGSTCHSQGSGNNDFTSAAVTQGDIDNVLCRIRATGTTGCTAGARMPQGLPALPASETVLFTKWKADNFYDCH